jgi:ketosteroid isomerase-like protein
MTAWLLLLAAGLLAGDDAARDVAKAITTLNQAFKDRDAAAIRRLMTDDHVAITGYYGGPQTAAQQLASLPDLKLTEYSQGKLTLTPVGKDAFLVTYPLTQKGTFQGKTVAEKCFASAVWVNRGGQWLEAFYQETALGDR